MKRVFCTFLSLCLCIVLLLASAGCIADQGFSEQKGTGVPVFQEVPGPDTIGPSKITAIAAGQDHYLVLRENGTVTAQGYRSRQCGWGACDIPKNLSTITAIGAGEGYSVALTDLGDVVTWGCRWDPPPRDLPQDYHVCGDHCPCRLPENISRVRSLSAGRYHVLAIRENGTVAAWGFNPYGQRDVPAGLKNVTRVSAGDTFSMALTDSGRVWVWGKHRGWVAPGNYTGIAAGFEQGLLLTSNGTLVTFKEATESDSPFRPIWHPDLTNGTAIAAGDRYFVALLENGDVVYWDYTGPFHYRTWGNVSDLHSVTAISSQGLSNLALKADGTVIEWGI